LNLNLCFIASLSVRFLYFSKNMKQTNSEWGKVDLLLFWIEISVGYVPYGTYARCPMPFDLTYHLGPSPPKQLPKIMTKFQPEDKRSFSKELAKALLENEQREKDALSSPNVNVYNDNEIEDAYLALCYDEPRLENDALCRELASALLGVFPDCALPSGKTKSKTPILGLSDRFVNGVLQITTVAREQPKIIKSDSSQPDYSTPYNGEQFTSSTLASKGYAELAVSSFLLGPLYCCRSLKTDQKDEAIGAKHRPIQKFLGSYNGRSSVDHDAGAAFGKGRDDATESFLRSMAEMTLPEDVVLDQSDTNEEKKESSKQEIIPVEDNSNDPMREIFAADEDPDDFDYGDDRYDDHSPAKVHDAAFQAILDSFDVHKLCQCKLLTAEEIVFRLESLLSELSYRRITLGCKAWKDWKVSEHLSSLTLEILQCLGYSNLDHLGMKFNNPLMALRDRAMDSMHGHDALESYLGLIRVLLKSDSSQVGKCAAKNTVDDKGLSPARAIGLSSLAGLCSCPDLMGNTKKKHIAKIREMIMECLYELVDCVEFVRPKKNDAIHTQPALPTWVRVSIALSRVIDFLTGVKSRTDCSRTDEFPGNYLSTSDAQNILQSGLFREIILLFTFTEETEEDNSSKQATTTAKAVVREQTLRMILVLSSKSQILGKYAARVPELTNILYSDTFRQGGIVDVISWYALLGGIASSNKGPQLRMKGVLILSGSELKVRCRTDFLQLCEMAVDTIKKGIANDSSLQDFLRLSNSFQLIPYLAECWKEAVASQGGSEAVKNGISNVMKNLPAFRARNEPGTDEVLDDNKKKESRIDSGTIAAVRKSCKSLVLLLEHEGNKNLQSARLSSKTD